MLRTALRAVLMLSLTGCAHTDARKVGSAALVVTGVVAVVVGHSAH